jgi:flagellar basal-body rod protein FlgB
LLESLFEGADVIQKSMQGLSARQRAIGDNVANADTPGYKRIQVGFERQLRSAIRAGSEPPELAMRTTSDRHFSLGPNATGLDQVKPEMVQVTNETYRNDGNNVDIEVEMANLAETNVRYNTMATLAKNKFDGMKNLIRDIR